MNRRAFVRLLGLGMAATAAVAAVDPEQLLWTPGAKTIFDLGARQPELVDWKIVNVDFSFSSSDLNLEPRFHEMLKQAVKEMADRMDARIMMDYNRMITMTNLAPGQPELVIPWANMGVGRTNLSLT